MGILINAMDMGLIGTNDTVRRAMADMMFRYEGEYTIRVNPPDRLGARTVLTQAATLSNTNGPIQNMRMIGHGGPGVQSMGRGDWSQVDYSNPRIVSGALSYDVLSNANIDSLYPELAVLGRCFAEDGVFQFHGCNVGEGIEGDSLLRKTARYLGVPVFAGAVVQFSASGTQPSLRGHQYWDTNYEGNVKRAMPNGVISFHVNMGSRGYQQIY